MSNSKSFPASPKSPYPLASREFHPEDSVVPLGPDHRVGGRTFTVIAGPCAVESDTQVRATAEAVGAAGVHALRGGIFKPRSSPYSFQGLGLDGLPLLLEAGRRIGVPVVTEVMDADEVQAVAATGAVLQIGARNMQNFRLLASAAEVDNPVILKRGGGAKIEELLLASEYLLAGGNANVILCERGIRTFDGTNRNTLDLGGVAYLKNETHLPVLVDPSHGTGRRELILPMARAAAACGADGIMVEVHVEPEAARSDGAQSLRPEQYRRLVVEVRRVVEAVGKSLSFASETVRC
ncbi:MAG: 3-deoxy-7-phosphoheptulonate synthase [Myxococcota bacterium]